jgi:hypothetical protein
MSATQVRNISGALEAFDAAANRDPDVTESPKQSDLVDISQGLRRSVGELMQYILGVLDETHAKMAADDDIDDQRIEPIKQAADNFRNELGQFAPHLAADDDASKPNTILGTHGQQAAKDDDADTSKAKAEKGGK